jgi:hypothetical protein
MRALSLAAAAHDAAVAIYHQRCQELGLEHRLSDPVFADFLNLALLLSQRVVEGRKLRLTILVPAEDLDLARQVQQESACGVVHVALPDTPRSDLVLNTLQHYLGSASDQASLLVIQQGQHATALRLSLLYFGASLTSGRSSGEPGVILALIRRSLTIRIEYGIVSVGVGMDWFLTLQQGEMLEIPRFEREIDAILAASGTFRNQLADFLVAANAGKHAVPSPRNGTAAPVLDIAAENEVRRTIGDALRQMIATIAQAHHGSTLLFGTRLSVHDTMHYQPGALNLDLPLGEALLQQLTLRHRTRLTVHPHQDEPEPDRSAALAAERTAAIIRAITNLSQADGAIIFDDSLTVIGSSIFLKVKESAAVAGGARRKSAQSFVRAHPGVAAIVISQDGFVSLCP